MFVRRLVSVASTILDRLALPSPSSQNSQDIVKERDVMSLHGFNLFTDADDAGGAMEIVGLYLRARVKEVLQARLTESG